jgi:hypothetical protein
MKTGISLVIGSLIALWLCRWTIPLFRKESEAPTYNNLRHPMPKWLVLACAICAAIGGGIIVAVIVDGWLTHF